MAGQIVGAQAQLESHIEELRRAAVAGGDAGALGQAEAQLGRLGSLARRLEHAGPSGIAALKAEVLAANFAAQALAQQSRTAAATAQNTEVALHAAQHDARKAVDDFTRDFYERKIFEKDLRFTSDEDERAYREREEQRRREIEKARAEGTPEGDLRALTLSREQLEDAGAHGADSNPAYHRLHASLSAKETALKHALAGQQTIHAAQDDPLAASAPVALPSDLLATVRGTGMKVSEGQGHGVTAARPTGEQRGLA